MDLKSRLRKLEKITVENQDQSPDVIIVESVDCRKGAAENPTPFQAIIPGIPDGPNGRTLHRGEDETPEEFLKRIDKEVHG